MGRRASRRRNKRLRALLVVLAGCFGIAVGVVIHATDVLHRVELLSVDLRFDARGPQPPPDDIVVIGIDARTFSDYPYTPYPFPRRLHASVIKRLVDARARVIAYDIQFTEPSSSARDDNALVAAVARAENRIVLATTETDAKGRTRVLGGDDFLLEIGARAGNAVMPADANGVIRRMPYEVDRLLGFGVVGAELVTGRPVPPFERSGAWIDFHGPPGTLTQYSFSAVEKGRVPVSAFRDKIVVVGAMAPSLQDVAATSTSGDQLMSGPEIQAEAISTVLRGFPLQDVPSWVGWLLTVGLGAIPILAGLCLGQLRGFLISIAAGALFVAGAYVAFRSGWIVPVVAPLAALAASATAVLAVLVVHEAVERRRVRDLFSRFVPERVVDEVIDHTDDELRLGGVRRECTVLFSDLRGFTTYSEETPPDRVISVLNAYLSEMSDAIMDGGGTLVSYLGDGIMAVFGAPLDQPDHRDRAVAVAREMLSRLERFNREDSHDFRMGIGINTGYAMCGNVGSERRVEYTAIGDSINTAARLESMTKGSDYDVLIADSTYSGLDSPARDLELVGELDVRGRRSKVRVWGLAIGASRAGREAMYQARLTPVPFFTALDESDLEVIARQADHIDVRAGEVLAREGDVGYEFFVIEEGTAEVTRNGDVLDTLGPGDFFGEMALVEEDRRTATVTASSPMTLIVLTSSSFRAIDSSTPQLHALVAGAIRRRRASVT
jgi:adenylate cyclase